MPYSALRQKQNTLIRKARDGSVFVADYTANAVTSLYGSAVASEVQTITINGTPAGGTFTLSFGGVTTAGIAYNATNTTVQTALQGLSTIGTGNATVTGGPGPGTPYVVTFAGTLANQNVQTIKASGAGLTGGTNPSVSVVVTTPGIASDLLALPAGYTDLGHISTDGVSYARSTDIANISSFGSVEPTRSDITSDTITMQVTCQETKLQTLAIYTGAAQSGITANSTTGEVKIAKPAQPGFTYYRAIGLFMDQGDYGEIWMARYMPRARVTEYGESTYTSGEDPIQYNVTLTGFEDPVLGYSHCWFFGGSGWKALLADMGM